MTLGLVCDACSTYNALGATACVGCGADLGVVHGAPKNSPTPTVDGGVPAAPTLTETRCASCGTMVPSSNKFCGSCGKPVVHGEARIQGKERNASKTMFFAVQQAPGRAKLILIKGDGYDGVTYVLSAEEHVAGRSEGEILFPEDTLLSPRHANFIYREGKLFVRDEGSTNGVFLRMKHPARLRPGSSFLIGEQLMRIDACSPELVPQPEADGTYFYASPRRPARFTLTQLLVGGAAGMVFRARNDALSIGREGNDVNFPDDPFISGRHAQVSALDTARLVADPTAPFELVDLGSKNGTFIRLQDEAPLQHGDYVFLGQQLLRVEIS
jgi:pSer/pThr/pTyr-binding forkhead associated (FHA) protein